MADIFIEHLITRRPDTKSRMIKAGIAAAVLVVCAASLLVAAFIPMLMPLLVAGACWGGFKLMKRQNVEFEYILTNGELDVDKIFDRSTRKRQLSVDCRTFEVLAPYKQAYTGEYANVTVRIDASSGSADAARYFAVYPGKDNQRTMLIFEPNERMLSAFKTYIPRKIKE